MENLRKYNLIIIVILFIGCKDYKTKNPPYEYKNYDYYIIVDFKIPSGKNRFFVYDRNNQLILQSLCEHGNGMGSTKTHPIFSNKIGSNCSSLGKFEIKGFNIMSSNIPSFVLKGLNSTNSNAFKRQLLIHPYYTIPDFEIYPFNLPMTSSRGCFVISPIKFKLLQKYIKNKKGILISIYQK